MATFRSFQEFGEALQAFAKDLTIDEKKTITEAMAKRGVELAKMAAQADLGGDDAFSGWRGKDGQPLPLATEVKSLADGSSLVKPMRWSAGLWTVADQGRKGYAAGDRRQSGTRVNKKDGAVVAKYKRVRRNTGPTPAKHTADDARRLMNSDPELQRICEREVIRVRKKRFD